MKCNNMTRCTLTVSPGFLFASGCRPPVLLPDTEKRKMRDFPDDSGKTRILKAEDMDRVYSIHYKIRGLK